MTEDNDTILVESTALEAKSDRKLTREKFYTALDHNFDDYNLTYTDEEKKKINIHLSKLATGSSAMVPLYCGGERCPFNDRCPLYSMGKHPEGKQCPIENQLLREFTFRYMEEFDVDPSVWTEVMYAEELAEIDIYLTRIKMILARPENAEMTIEQLTGYSVQGHPIKQQQLLPILQQKEKLESRRSRIIKLMVGDRQEKYKKQAVLKEVSRDDIASKMAEARRAVDQLVSKVNQAIKPSSEDVLTPEDLLKE